MPYRRTYSKKRSYKRSSKSWKKSSTRRKPLRARSTTRRFSAKPFFKARRSAFKAKKRVTFTRTPEGQVALAVALRKSNKISKEAAAEMLADADRMAVQSGTVITFRHLGAGQPIPDRVRTKFTYWFQITTAQTISVGIWTQVFSGGNGVLLGNTLNTPLASDMTATDGVNGYVQFGYWFENYKVFAGKLTLDLVKGANAVDDPTSLPGPLAVGALIVPENAFPTPPQFWEERDVTPNFTYKDSFLATQPHVHFTSFVKSKDVFGPAESGVAANTAMTDIGPFLSSTEYNGATFFRPQLNWGWRVLACSPDAVGAGKVGVETQFIVTGKIEYWAECFNTTGFNSLWSATKGSLDGPAMLAGANDSKGARSRRRREHTR